MRCQVANSVAEFWRALIWCGWRCIALGRASKLSRLDQRAACRNCAFHDGRIPLTGGPVWACASMARMSASGGEWLVLARQSAFDWAILESVRELPGVLIDGSFARWSNVIEVRNRLSLAAICTTNSQTVSHTEIAHV